MKRVSLALVKRLGACDYGVEDFEATFGKFAAVTKENLEKAIEAGLSVSWLAYELGFDPKRTIVNRIEKKVFMSPKTGKMLGYSPARDKEYTRLLDAAAYRFLLTADARSRKKEEA